MDDYLALRSLAERYARGVDRRDPGVLLSAFLPDARLRVFQPSESDTPRTDRTGHDELAQITELIARYDRTFHLLGNTDYDIGTDAATGEVYCLAHHLSIDGDNRTDYVMHIRYQDEYRRDDAGQWKIADRRVMVDWAELRPANER